MLNLGVLFEIAILYLSLSKTGKRFLKKTFGKLSRVNKVLKKPASWDLKKTLYFIKTLKVCDKVFIRQEFDQLCSDLGRDKSAMYARFVAYGWFSLLMLSKMLDAFNLVHDEEAEERCVLFSFMHREWNDLFDNQGFSFKELATAFDYQATIPQQLIFLRRFKQARDNLAPPERFGKFYQHMQGLDICSLFEYTPEKAEIVLDQVAPFVVLAFMYSMLPDIPERLKEVAKPVARWLYMLDELADIEHDKKMNRVTYMIMTKNPENAMWEQYEECCRVILRNAPNPDKLINFMEIITSRVIDAKKQGVDIESSFFNLG